MKKKYITAAIIMSCILSINIDCLAAKKPSSKIIPKHKVESAQDVRIVTNQGPKLQEKESAKATVNKEKTQEKLADKNANPKSAAKQDSKVITKKTEGLKQESKAGVKPTNNAKPVQKPVPKNSDLVIRDGKTYFRGSLIPNDFKEIKIVGYAVATKHQAYTYLKQTNPNARLDCSMEEIVNVYWLEASREGIRPDLAFCQALLETGFFRYGGDVLPSQNNFCGLGTVGGGAKGVRFKTPQEGARAHIQHLLAYSRTSLPQTAVIDPRYKLVHGIRMERGLIDKWYGLNGTWAMGGNYCEKIMTHYQNMLTLPPGDKKDNKIKLKDSKEESTASHRMRERAWKYIEEKDKK